MLIVSFTIILTGCESKNVNDPEIPVEFREMESISYSGADSVTEEDLEMSLGLGAFSIIELKENNSFMTAIYDSEEIMSIYSIYEMFNEDDYSSMNTESISNAYNKLSANKGLEINEEWSDPDSDTQVSIKSDLSASFNEENLLDSITSLFLDNTNTSFSDVSFNFSLNLTETDIKVLNAPIPLSKINAEYFRALADVKITYSGSDLGFNMAEQELTGKLNINMDVTFKIAAVISSNNPAVKGCKFVATSDYSVSLKDFDVSEIDPSNFEMESFLNLSLVEDEPSYSYSVFDNNNNFLFEDTKDFSITWF